MSKCGFTICTKSYFGIASTLRESFLSVHREYDFFIIIVDYDNYEYKENYVLSAKEIMDITEKEFLDMAFKYNITEFCTSVKPYGFKYLFRKNYDLAIYLDPDILVYNTFSYLEKNDASIYLIPHITEIKPTIKNEWPQQFFLKFGIFNCGFVALRNDCTGNIIAQWWAEKLNQFSFADPDMGIYTDQKWMDMVFSFVDMRDICIIRDLGYDLAPWNFSEQMVKFENNEYYVLDRETQEKRFKLCFVHYSTINYKKLIENNEVYSRDNLGEIPKDFVQLIDVYREKLIKNNALNYLELQYSYGLYENGIPIIDSNRRLYRAAIENGYNFNNPFSVEKDSFYEVLCKSKMISQNGNKKIESSKQKPAEDGIVVKIFIFILRLCFSILKEEKYMMLMKALRKYSRIENNLFLLKMGNK